MKKTKLKMLSSEILRDKVLEVKHAGKMRELAENVKCTAAFLYWWLNRPDSDMRLELACRVFNEAVEILERHTRQKEKVNHD